MKKQSLHFESELPNQAACRKQGTRLTKPRSAGTMRHGRIRWGNFCRRIETVRKKTATNRSGPAVRQLPKKPRPHHSRHPARQLHGARPDARRGGEAGEEERRCPTPPFHALKQQKKVRSCDLTLKRRLPTLPHDKCSTIGVSELNFSVRNGKRWNLTTITT